MSNQENTIADAIAEAPAWALVSLTMPDPQLRRAGADELARWINRQIEGLPSDDRRQLGLPL